jgi:lysophospholipase L1-like esterase
MKNILLLGSSIIYLFKECKINNYQPHSGDKVLRTCNIINKGILGLKMNRMLSKSYFDKNIISSNKYDYMIFYCGNNDLKQGIDPTEIVKNIKLFIKNFQQLYPKTKIIIISILFSPKNYKLNLIDDIRYINQNLKKIDDILYINVNRELSHKKYYTKDDVHLNLDGYNKLNSILQKIVIC